MYLKFSMKNPVKLINTRILLKLKCRKIYVTFNILRIKCFYDTVKNNTSNILRSCQIMTTTVVYYDDYS